MSNTARVEARATVLAMVLSLASLAASAQAPEKTPQPKNIAMQKETANSLSARQRAVVPIAALAAIGDLPRLNTALNQGLGAGLSVNDAKEVLVQVYAYAGFPRSLNALTELMKVVDDRRQRGLAVDPGATPSRAIPKGEALLAAGTANQTRLTGAPVQGPIFEFAPAIDEFLKTHLFGDIFERDNLDWQTREVATVSMLSALSGVEAQLESHIRISMNVGVTPAQLRQVVDALLERVSEVSAQRARAALDKQLAAAAQPSTK